MLDPSGDRSTSVLPSPRGGLFVPFLQHAVCSTDRNCDNSCLFVKGLRVGPLVSCWQLSHFSVALGPVLMWSVRRCLQRVCGLRWGVVCGSGGEGAVAALDVYAATTELALFFWSGSASCPVAWEEQLSRYQLASSSPRSSG